MVMVPYPSIYSIHFSCLSFSVSDFDYGLRGSVACGGNNHAFVWRHFIMMGSCSQNCEQFTKGGEFVCSPICLHSYVKNYTCYFSSSRVKSSSRASHRWQCNSLFSLFLSHIRLLVSVGPNFYLLFRSKFQLSHQQKIT